MLEKDFLYLVIIIFQILLSENINLIFILFDEEGDGLATLLCAMGTVRRSTAFYKFFKQKHSQEGCTISIL